MSETLYFAYGSNMSETVLVERRRIQPIAFERARLDGFRLVFDLAGLPLVEPAFASIAREEGATTHGVLYRLSTKDFGRLHRQESPSYATIDVEVHGETSGRVTAQTYKNTRPAAGLLPSRRYLALILDGARARGLPPEYVAALEAQPSAYVPVASEMATGLWWVARGVARLALAKGKRRR